MLKANVYAGGSLDRVYEQFAVAYLRPLAAGESAAKSDGSSFAIRPARMPFNTIPMLPAPADALL